MDTKKQIGIHLKKLRKEKTNLSYVDFAQKIGINKNTYYRVEQGDKDYTLSVLEKIIEYHNISLSQFFIDAGL